MTEFLTEHRARIEKEIRKGAKRSIILLLEEIIDDARARNASDIHIDIERDHLSVRLRIDGLLESPYQLPFDCHSELISRLKIVAGLRTDERFKPHDGRFTLHLGESLIEVRLSIIPTYHGENAVLRLLSTDSHTQTLAELGLDMAQEKIIRLALARSHGLLLITGPTGSGKTTTLYSLLETLRNTPRSLVTIEDPVEYALEGVTQIQVHHQFGITFAQGLRALLRQDPDVIMVGEIRDSETATLAVQAAMTGHLVLSTLHTNNAHAAIPRLIDMGIEPYLIASTVHLIIAQRLVRMRCKECQALQRLCVSCGGTGYRGRIGIFELLPVTEELRKSLTSETRNSTPEVSEDFKSLREDGLEKVRSGRISLEELNRILHA
jgi:type II secretory ATPase GspE/PulE/Tfp pilus assembly ATPase PilB-like protein